MTPDSSSSTGFNAASGAPSKATVADFFAAAARGDETTVRALLETSPDLLTARENTRGATALIMAARQGNTQMMDLLFGQGANPLAEDNAGMDALMNAASEGQQAACFFLMNLGFDPARKNRSGLSAISAARAADFYGLGESLVREAPLYREKAKTVWHEADVNVATGQPIAPLKPLSFKAK